MDARPLIFCTNDDGIDSPGLRAAVEAVVGLGDVLVVAPRRQQSSTGRGLGGGRDEKLCSVAYALGGGERVQAYACDATPAQTVLHALHVLGGSRRPDLIVSGINYGENLGTNVTLSGTVGAAIEGASAGVRALAAAMETDTAFHHRYGEVNWEGAKFFVRLFAERLLAAALPADVDVLNVVIPDSATPATPWRVTRQSRHPYFSAQWPPLGFETRIGDARIGVFCDRAAIEADSDIAAILRDRIVSVTPLSLDCTSRTDLGAFERQLRA